MIRAKDIEHWDERFHVLEEYPLFRGMKQGFTLKEKHGLFLSDFLKVISTGRLAVSCVSEPGSGSVRADECDQ
jgi:hypothetical protein